jgi:hypothetical protein
MLAHDREDWTSGDAEDGFCPMKTVPLIPRAWAAWPRVGAGGLAWALWALILLGLAMTLWLDRLLGQAGLLELTFLLGSGNFTLAIAAVSAATIGSVVVSRRPRHRVGWLLVALGLSISACGFAYSYTRYGLVARPGALPAASYLAGFADGAVVTFLSFAGFVLLLTPTGSLPSPRWRWWARVQVAALVVAFLSSVLALRPLYPDYPEITSPIGVPALEHWPLAAAFPAAALIILVGLVVGAGSLVFRFRRAHGAERQQLRWLAWGAALAALALLIALAALAVEEADSTLFQAALGVSVALLPLATGAAILRYRLYDLDRIISRTLAYGLLTVLLGLGYAAVVLGLGRLLPQGSSLVVAGATLAVAAVFQPARRRVQRAVDRQFNRRRYDAARAIEAFAARLRQQVDLDALRMELLTLVEETLQPTQASLWLRPHTPSRKADGQAAAPAVE